MARPNAADQSRTGLTFCAARAMESGHQHDSFRTEIRACLSADRLAECIEQGSSPKVLALVFQELNEGTIDWRRCGRKDLWRRHTVHVPIAPLVCFAPKTLRYHHRATLRSNLPFEGSPSGRCSLLLAHLRPEAFLSYRRGREQTLICQRDNHKRITLGPLGPSVRMLQPNPGLAHCTGVNKVRLFVLVSPLCLHRDSSGRGTWF